VQSRPRRRTCCIPLRSTPPTPLRTRSTAKSSKLHRRKSCPKICTVGCDATTAKS